MNVRRKPPKQVSAPSARSVRPGEGLSGSVLSQDSWLARSASRITGLSCWMLLAGGLTSTFLPFPLEAETLYLADFSSSDGGFIPDDPYVLWEYGAPAEAVDAPMNLPVWGIGLSSLYIKDARSILRSPVLSVKDTNSTLVLVHSYATDGSTGDCADALPLNDDLCADGGTLRLRYGTDRLVSLVPDGGYPDWMALDGVATGAFAGGSGGIVTSYFDLQGLPEGSYQVELLFASNDVRTSTGSGWYVQSIGLLGGDAIPPELSIPIPLKDTTNVEGTYDVWALARDNRGLSGLEVQYSTSRGESAVLKMFSSPEGPPLSFSDAPSLTDTNEESWWKAGIPAQAPNTTVWYSVVAIDQTGNVTRFPPRDPYEFSVYLPGPSAVELADPPLEATELTLTWEEPGSASGCTLMRYRVLHHYTDVDGKVFTDDQSEDSVLAQDTTAVVKPTGYPGQDTYSVIPVFSCNRGDGSPDFSAEGAAGMSPSWSGVVPRIVSVTPSEVWQGSHVTLEVVGAYTRFASNLQVELGEGFTLVDKTILDVTRCRLEVQVATNAPLGPAPLTLSWDDSLRVTDLDAMSASSYAERPLIYQVIPASLRQRTKATLTFYGQNVAFEQGQVQVTFGEGITAGEPVVPSPTTFTVDVEVAGWAAAGVRPVTIVAGAQTFSIQFEVESIPLEVSTGCSVLGSDPSVSPAVSGLVCLLMAGGGILARRRTRPAVPDKARSRVCTR